MSHPFDRAICVLVGYIIGAITEARNTIRSKR